MKKVVLALGATAALAGSASAADLAARPYTKAPMMAPAYSWTGFYIFGGIGGGRGGFHTAERAAGRRTAGPGLGYRHQYPGRQSEAGRRRLVWYRWRWLRLAVWWFMGRRYLGRR